MLASRAVCGHRDRLCDHRQPGDPQCTQLLLVHRNTQHLSLVHLKFKLNSHVWLVAPVLGPYET